MFALFSQQFRVLRIAVNTRLLLPDRLEGIGWFSHELLRRVVIAHPEHEFIFFFDRQPDPQFIYADNVRPVVLHPQARHPFLFILWFEWSVRRALKKYKADVFLSPDGFLSLFSGKDQIAVIHDLNFEHYPEDLPFLVRWYYRFFFPRFARKAKKIVTVSHYSKADICQLYKLSPEKIEVVYNGLRKGFEPAKEELVDEVRSELSDGHPYFVFIGALHPRKNIRRMLEAYDAFRGKNGGETRLVIIGERYWWNNEMQDTYEQMIHRDEVIFTGHLTQEKLQQVLASSMALLFVPYFEGFGVPIIEAFACEVPVITSCLSSMPEVAGDAALLADPFDVSSISQAMQKVCDQAELRKELILKGRERVKLFSWDRSAQDMWAVLEEFKNNSTEN